MNRREFIQAASAALISASLPITLKSKPIVYYIDLAIIDTSLNKAIFWGNSQKQGVARITHSTVLGGSGKHFEEILNEEVTRVTGLMDFELKPHPWQEKITEKLNNNFGGPGNVTGHFVKKYSEG